MCTVSHRGIALLMVLWVLTILMVIVFSFSFMTRTETHATASFREGIEERFIAEAAIQRAITELFYRMQNLAVEGSEVWKIDGTSFSGKLGDREYIVKITDESGKVDINAASPLILKNLLVNLGVSVEDADVIVDSLMDWKDPDDLYRLHGAESDYYMSLPSPYKAKNANFDTLEELILVRGVTREILYGSSEKKGIIDYLTVNSRRSTININAAPREVLIAIPGMTSEIADGIMNYRKIKEITSIGEVQGMFGANYTLIVPYVSTGGSNIYTIDSISQKINGKPGFSVRATVVIEGTNKYRYVYYKTPAHITQ